MLRVCVEGLRYESCEALPREDGVDRASDHLLLSASVSSGSISPEKLNALLFYLAIMVVIAVVWPYDITKHITQKRMLVLKLKV